MSPHSLALAGLFAAQALAGGLNVPLPPGMTFDYVVVGGGPGGLTVANRLTEDPNIQVLVVEAGDADVYEEKIMVPAFQGSSGFVAGHCGGYNWCDVRISCMTWSSLLSIKSLMLRQQTVPQTNLNGRNITIPQGFGLGGGTLINAMLWNRGDTQDYDTWAALGNEGWDFASMLPYFERVNILFLLLVLCHTDLPAKQSETFTAETNQQFEQMYGIGEDSSQHGFSGPQNVTFPNFLYQPSQNFFEAMNGLGIPTQTDPANPPAKGAMFLPQGISPWNQSRADARRMRWDPVQTRPNFWIVTRQHVQRILFEGGCATPSQSGLRAVGVEIISSPGQAPWTAVATREVILSAGSLRSVQTLELSGIGDTNILNGLGLTTRVNLPGVGNNLQDHMLTHLTQGFNNNSYVYSNVLNNQTINDAARQLYYTNRTGPYTFGPPDGNAFLSVPQFSNRSQALAAQAAAQGDADYLAPGLDPSVVQGYSRQRALLIPALNDSSRGGIEYLQDCAGGTQISNMRPLTRGTVHAVSTDAFVYPALDMRYASNPVDYELMMDAVQWNDLLFQQPAIQIMQPIQYYPGHGDAGQALQAFLNGTLGTEFHPSGTVAMQPQADGGVVSPELLVYGTQNLRVVDASICPIIPASHMEAVVYGIGEKAADMIKAAQSTIPRITPTTPLDTSSCTLTASTKRAEIEDGVAKTPNDYPMHNAYYRRANPAPSLSTSGSPKPTNVGAYPIYDSTAVPTPTGAAEPASFGQPEGAALEFGSQLINGVGGLLGGILGSLGDGLGDTVGSLLGNGEDESSIPPKVARGFDA